MFKWLMGWLEPLRDKDVYPRRRVARLDLPFNPAFFALGVMEVGQSDGNGYVQDCSVEAPGTSHVEAVCPEITTGS